MKRKINILILYFILCLVSIVNAQNVQRKTILDFKNELKLSKDQEEKIRKIISDFERKVKEINDKMLQVDQEIKKLLEAEGDIKEVEKKVNEFFSLRAKAVVEEIKAGREIDKLLTPEQLKKWREIRKGGKP